MKNGINGASGFGVEKKHLLAKAEAETKQKADADYKTKKTSIFGDNETKSLKREVSGEKQEILVGKGVDGKKVRVNAETLEELVAVDTSGKNKYITKSEFNKMIEQVLNVKELREGMTAEFQHGHIVFKRGGDILTAKEIREDAGLIAQRQKEKAEAEAREQARAQAAKMALTQIEKVKVAPNFNKTLEINIEKISEFTVQNNEEKSADAPAANNKPVIKPKVKQQAPKKPAWVSLAAKPHSKEATWFRATQREFTDFEKEFENKTVDEVAARLGGFSAKGPLSPEKAAHLKEVLIRQNPSVYNPDGSIRKDADYKKLDIPNVQWLMEEFSDEPVTKAQSKTTPKPSIETKPSATPKPKAEETPQHKKTATTTKTPTMPKKIITTQHKYERGLSFPNGNSIEAEDKKSVWDSDASFKIGGGKYNLKKSRRGLITTTLDYGDLKSNKQYGFINGETGTLNPNSRLFESQYDRNHEKIYFEGKGELNGAQVLKYKNKVAVQLNGKYYDLNILLQQNKKVEIK